MQDLPPGHWVVMDRDRKQVFAIADTCAEIMAKADELRKENVLWVGRTPGLHPSVANRPLELMEDESPNIMDDIKKVFGNPDIWLDNYVPVLGYQKPRDLIGTDQEKFVRYVLRAIRHGGMML